MQHIDSINWDNFIITANDEVYQNISSALSDTGTLITTLIVVITAVSMVLIILILSMSIRSRKRETGICWRWVSPSLRSFSNMCWKPC